MCKINKKKYNSTKGRQQQRCIITGRTKGNIRDLSFSRHTTKQQGLLNRLQNIKVGS
jgi:ribosomal protein S14